MAYTKNTLIVRPRSSLGGISDIFDGIKDVAKGALNFYGQAQRDAGAAAAAQAQQPVIAPSSGIDTGTILLIGGLGIGAILLLKRKK